jgi:hypothetical protein
MTDRFFQAVRVHIGFCRRPECRAVHIQFPDGNDEPCAQAVIACENIESLCDDLRSTRDRVVGAHASVRQH